MKKILIITSIPSPYRIPLLNRIHVDSSSKGWKLKVIFLARGYARRKWNVDESEFKFEFEYLHDPYLTIGEGFTSLSISLPALLYREKPSLIIVGGFTIPAIWVYLYSRMYGVPYFVWSGETLTQSRIRMDVLKLRVLLRTFLARYATGAVVYGSEAKTYLVSLGMKSETIFTAINTVDTAFFEKSTKSYRLEKNVLLAKMNLPDINILYVGHLTKPKGIQCFFKACKLIEHRLENVGIHIVGDGEYREELVKLSTNLKLKNVYFWGFKQKNELPLYYGICDLFVFPSFYDVWGLVCIEAMSTGMPVLSSVYAGVTADLIKNNINGFVIDPANEVDFSSKIDQVISSYDLRQTLGAGARKTIIDNFLIENSVRGFMDAIIYVENTNTGNAR